MTETTPGRETIQVVEIQQPFCANTFGSAPCTAVAPSAEFKCYNTRGTCADPSNFSRSSLRLFFSRGHLSEAAPISAGSAGSSWLLSTGSWDDDGVWRDDDVWRDSTGISYIIPSLVSVSTSPTRINLAASNPDASPLGNRALCTIVFQDHPHSDRVVDPYLADRTWNPLDRSRGSFWSRWIARNKYRANVLIKVYEGYLGQNLSQMSVRSYFMESINGPDSSGRVTIQGKDILAKLEARKAQAPVASNGVLYAAITDSATSLQIAGATLSQSNILKEDGGRLLQENGSAILLQGGTSGEYPASGTIRIGDEVLTYTDLAVAGELITLSGLTRGTDGTTASDHSEDDSVQICLRYTSQNIDDVAADLLQSYGGVPPEYLNLTEWDEEVSAHLSLYQMSTLITKPTPVDQLISELQESAPCYLWWDERQAVVRLRAIRGVTTRPETITAEYHIIAGSFSITEQPRERTSQVWIYFGQRDATGDVTDEANYSNLHIAADLGSETNEKYGEPSIRKIFSRWLQAGALATATAQTILTRYVDTPSQCTFRMDAKDRGFWVGDSFLISHHIDTDQYGNRRQRQWTVISAREVVPGEVVEYVCADTTLYNRVYLIQGAEAGDYPGAALAEFSAAYISGADGLLSDGSEGAKIS